ncbi:cupin domain-containing protein [Phreatobacter stygius]|uniref:Cupin domain-containing protein n=1 Tax=Phreatobacter stygius TaxID=1940610 RepID=A0A4D7AWY4_9HYPH|nr:cupin domain-containing protein [Phreatobacter stygius]QCI64561.1 cupin domain-containing protein [Phreatobacter stygius]
MHVNRFADLKPYDAPGHHGMHMLRMQGREAGPADMMWLGVSQILPGGSIDLSSSPDEKFYVVLEGDLTVETESGSVRLGVWDSCRIAPHEKRALKNPTNRTVVVLLAMPLPKPQP